MSDATPKPKAKNSVRGAKKNEATAVQRFLPIAEIKQDTVVLKNGGIRAVLSVTSMNFSLKSDDEQQAIVTSYQQFLNSVSFPIQIVIHSAKLNMDAYISDIEKRSAKHENPLLKEQTMDYARFIERLIDVGDIMQKCFYVVIPMDPPGSTKMGFFQKYLSFLNPGDTREKAMTRKRQFEEIQTTLNDRVSLVQAGLTSVGLPSERLKTGELIELYYQIYNPLTSREQKLSDLGVMGVKEYVL